MILTPTLSPGVRVPLHLEPAARVGPVDSASPVLALLHRTGNHFHPRQNRHPQNQVHEAGHPGVRAPAIRCHQSQVLQTAQHEGA